MHKILETLIDLQDIDSRLQKVEEEKGDLPQRVQQFAAEVEQTRETLSQKTEQKKENVHEKSNLDNEVELIKEKLKKYKVQLYQVKTNKEYDAITVEIETSQEAIDEKGYRSLELEEAIEEQNAAIAELQSQLEEQEKNLKVLQADLDSKLEKTREHEADLKEKRHEVQSRLPRPIYSTYERIRLGRSGVAVAMLQDGACSECSSRVPPQRGLEIRMMNRINTCEVCGRILVWRSENPNIAQNQ